MLAAVLLASLLLAQAKLDPDECAVWQRELSFAQSVDNHDVKAFAAHLHPGTVFVAGTENPLRGVDAVLKNWAALIEGKPLRLRWRPDAKSKYRVGTFTTIWGRESADAPWLVLFDAGAAAATPVDDLAAAEKFMEQAPASCPAR